jgi:MFS family permease
VLAVFNWRYVFLISVPFGFIGTIWSFKLKELSKKAIKTKIDIWGNLTFVLGITLILVGITYGLLPYGNSPMGWNNPWVIAAMIVGLISLILFPFIESRVESPMFRLDLFRNRSFAFANMAGLLGSLGRGGLMFMLILLLQGIWLPLHGYSYDSTPFWAGIYMLPLTAGIVIMGPLSGVLSDTYGPRWISTGGMIVVTISFLLFAALPINFNFWEFAFAEFLMGIGSGMFSTPNTASIMNSVPSEDRGVASGMISTLRNTAGTASMAIFFTIVIVGITQRFPDAMLSSLTSIGAVNLAPILTNIPPTAALFSAFLGYNPVNAILTTLPSSIVAHIPGSTLNTLTGITWFPSTLAKAFLPSLQISFIIGAIISIIGAILSALRGERYIHENKVIIDKYESEIAPQELEIIEKSNLK